MQIPINVYCKKGHLFYLSGRPIYESLRSEACVSSTISYAVCVRVSIRGNLHVESICA